MLLVDSLKNEIIERLRKIDPGKIFLFGSFAYGNPNKDSDIDLLIVKDEVLSKIQETVEARKMLKGILRPFDTIVVSKDEFDFYKDQVNSICFEANKRGVLLYERKKN